MAEMNVKGGIRMHHVIALCIKIGVVSLLTWIVLYLIFDQFNLAETAAVALLVALFIYVLDLTIMPLIKNIYTTLGDVITAFLIMLFLGTWMGSEPVELYTGFVIVSVIIGIFEFFYHRFLLNRIFPEDEEGSQSMYGEKEYKRVNE